MDKENAEAHGGYTKGLLVKSLPPEIDNVNKWLGICEYLYVQAMLHGYKHGLQTLEETANVS